MNFHAVIHSMFRHNRKKHLYFDTYSRLAHMHQGVSLQKQKKIICDSPICLSHFQFQTRPKNIHYEKHASCIQSIPHNTTPKCLVASPVFVYYEGWYPFLASSVVLVKTNHPFRYNFASHSEFA